MVSFDRWIDKEDVVYIYNEILFSHQKGWIPTICFDVDATGGSYAEWSKSIGEGQTLYVLIHLGNINNSEREYKGREKKCVGNIRKGDRTWRLLTLGNELGCYSVCWQIEHQ